MMESVDKLRDCTWIGSGKVNEYLDEIEAEIAETEAFCKRVEEAARNNDELDVFGVAYIPLPVDADGVPIRVGDRVKDTCVVGHEWDVLAVTRDYWVSPDGSKHKPGQFVHAKTRTLEDVLEEYYDKRGWDEADNCALNADELTAKYAEEIRELLGGDAE